jgi:hypothetical protein
VKSQRLAQVLLQSSGRWVCVWKLADFSPDAGAVSLSGWIRRPKPQSHDAQRIAYQSRAFLSFPVSNRFGEGQSGDLGLFHEKERLFAFGTKTASNSPADAKKRRS